MGFRWPKGERIIFWEDLIPHCFYKISKKIFSSHLPESKSAVWPDPICQGFNIYHFSVEICTCCAFLNPTRQCFWYSKSLMPHVSKTTVCVSSLSHITYECAQWDQNNLREDRLVFTITKAIKRLPQYYR